MYLMRYFWEIFKLMTGMLKIKELLKMDIQNCSNSKSQPFGYISSKSK